MRMFNFLDQKCIQCFIFGPSPLSLITVSSPEISGEVLSVEEKRNEDPYFPQLRELLSVEENRDPR